MWKLIKGLWPNITWDAVKDEWKAWGLPSWRTLVMGAAVFVWQYLSSASWLAIFGVVAFAVVVIDRVDAIRERRRLRPSISPDLESQQKVQIGTQEKVHPAVYQNKLTIDYAGYGLSFGAYCDVTDDVRKLVQDNQLRVHVEAALFSIPDPYENRPKNLMVIYSHGNYRGQTKSMKEHGLIELPER